MVTGQRFRALRALTICTALVLFVITTTRRRPPAVVWIFTVVIMITALGGAGFYSSKMRFLLPACPLLFPFALALAWAKKNTVL